MVVKGQPDTGERGRTFYPLEGFAATVSHFVVRRTTPANPFVPHRHAQREMWYIMEGNGLLWEDGREHAVGAGDLVLIASQCEHGLRTESTLTWICLG